MKMSGKGTSFEYEELSGSIVKAAFHQAILRSY
jgi:hypothetical protein